MSKGSEFLYSTPVSICAHTCNWGRKNTFFPPEYFSLVVLVRDKYVLEKMATEEKNDAWKDFLSIHEEF